ncbi:MAG: class I SAM-dependent methyltransferase [Cyclobacteriaceae bacterium]
MSKTAEFFNKPENYLDKDYNVRVRKGIVAELVGEVIDRNILDVGCGDGRVSLQFALSNYLTLIDASPGMLDLACKNTPNHVKKRVTHILSTLEDAPITEESYDIIIAMGIFAHLNSWKRGVDILAKSVKRGGHVVIQISDSANPLVRGQLRPMGKRQHTLNKIDFESLVETCGQAGLKLQTKKHYGFTVRGMGVLPNRLLYQFTLATTKWRLFRRMATEVIAVFQKV